MIFTAAALFAKLDVQLPRSVTAFAADRIAHKDGLTVAVQAVRDWLRVIAVAEKAAGQDGAFKTVTQFRKTGRQIPRFLLREPGDRRLIKDAVVLNQIGNGMGSRADGILDRRRGFRNDLPLGVASRFFVYDAVALALDLKLEAKCFERIAVFPVVQLSPRNFPDRRQRAAHRVMAICLRLTDVAGRAFLVAYILHVRPHIAKRRGI